LLTEVLAEKPSLFLIDLAITDAFKVIITLDDDNGVVLQDCIDISRAIDLSLDRKSKIIL
jgi:ribosome maturation factor RimP